MSDTTAEEAETLPRKWPRLTVGRIVVLGLLLLLGTCTAYLWTWDRRVLPPQVKWDAVLGSSSQDGFREGCQMAVYRLSQSTIARLKAEGMRFLQSGPRPQVEQDRNRYGAWWETPGFIDVERNGEGAKHTVYGLYALGGCGDAHGPQFHASEIRKALQKPGSYFTVTGNEEGIIVVVPDAGLAAYYYVG